MENLRDHTLAWLDSIGADGLMTIHGAVYKTNDIDIGVACKLQGASNLVPAYRHADGSYHAEAEYPCPKCSHFNDAIRMCKCPAYVKWSDWLAHKEN